MAARRGRVYYVILLLLKNSPHSRFLHNNRRGGAWRMKHLPVTLALRNIVMRKAHSMVVVSIHLMIVRHLVIVLMVR